MKYCVISFLRRGLIKYFRRVIMRKIIFLFLLVLVMIVAVACNDQEQASSEGEGEFTPEESIEIVAPAGAGGGWDTTARSVAQVLDEEGIIDQDIGVVNKEGGGGSVGWRSEEH